MESLINAVEANEKIADNEAQESSQLPNEEGTNNENNSEAEATTNSEETKKITEILEKAEETSLKAAPVISEEDSKWHTVGIYPGLSATVNNFIDNNLWTSAGTDLNSDNIPDLSSFPRINLEPGTAYRFRIRAINSCGAGEWSEVSSFKTCMPGFPGAPSAIKISKSSEGAHLTWDPPSCTNPNEIIEYSVYLAVKPGRDKEGKTSPGGTRTPAQLAFVRVYVGSANQCTVSQSGLSAAHVDCSNKPAIIFRIAARNEKGYGPATQVRWLQDAVQHVASNNTSNSGNSTNQTSLASPQRGAKVEQGASPIKRFKSNSVRNIFSPEI